MRKIKKFTGNENHLVTLAEVNEYTRNYRKYFGEKQPAGGFFKKQAVLSLIQQNDAVGIRYYYGIDDNQQLHLILTGVSADRSDLLEGEPLKVSVLNPLIDVKNHSTTGQIAHSISMAAAAATTAAYRNTAETHQPKGGFFFFLVLKAILWQDNCTGLRFYYGANDDGKRVICLMGVDTYAQDMIDGILAEKSYWCPPFCADFNFLNSDINRTTTAIAHLKKVASKKHYSLI